MRLAHAVLAHKSKIRCVIMRNALLLMCSEIRFPALWGCWSPGKAPPLSASTALLFPQWMRGPLPITDHHSGSSDLGRTVSFVAWGWIAQTVQCPEICWVLRTCEHGSDLSGLTSSGTLRGSLLCHRRSRSCGSVSRKNQGGPSAAPHLGARVWTAEETDGFLQDGGIHHWQLRAALQWSCWQDQKPQEQPQPQ